MKSQFKIKKDEENTPCVSDPVKTNKPAGIPDKSQRVVGSYFHPTEVNGEQFLVSGNTSGAALEKSVGSGDHPQTNPI